MAARVGANVATSRKLATTRTSIWPIVRPTRATTIGMPAATIEPNAMSRMMMATRRPIASLLGGSWPANSSTWPWAPTASSVAVERLDAVEDDLGVLGGDAQLAVLVGDEGDGGVGDGLVRADRREGRGQDLLLLGREGLRSRPGPGRWPRGQSVPSGPPCGSSGLVTQATESRAAISVRRGTTCSATAGSTAVPVAGDHTMVAPPSSRLVSVPLDASRSVATFDSVSGRSKESFSSPPTWVPRPTTTTRATSQETRAITGRRTAQADKPGMGPSSNVRGDDDVLGIANAIVP